jgi:hypothetical protein
MSFRNRIASLMHSVLARPPATRGLLRDGRLVSAVLRQRGAGEGPRRIVDEDEVGSLASALRDAARIGEFARLYLAMPTDPMTLGFEGGVVRSIRIGWPAERLGSPAFLAEIDGAVYIVAGRRLGFLFGSPTDSGTDAVTPDQAAEASASEDALPSPAAHSAAGAWPWTSAASEA